MLRKLPSVALVLVAFFLVPGCNGILGDFSVGSTPVDASTDGTIPPQPDAGDDAFDANPGPGLDATTGDDATPGDDSGGSVPDSGPPCGPSTCATGCCSGNTCVLGTDPTACGTGGTACGTCGSGQACTNGSCTCGGASCTSGCCNASGACTTATNAACGANGGVCAACGPNQECNADGKCVCDSTSCPNGCCDANEKCVVPSVMACGTAGASCKACTAGQLCTAGACQCPPPSCSGTSLNTCGTTTACSALGCSSTGTAHCEVIVPTAPVNSGDVTATGVANVTIAASETLDTTTGAITGVRAGGGGVISGIGFRIASGVGIWTFGSLTVPAGVTLHFTNASTNAAALVANTTITISGVLDARGYDATGALCGAGSPGPAGNAGGKPTNGAGAGAGGGKGTVTAFYSGGPSGGSYGTTGGAGGEGCNAENSPVVLTPGAAATTTYGTAALNPNLGGSGGGAGTDTNLNGGGGGGAIQLVAGTSITINAGGGINAGGCNGHSSTTFSDTGTAGGSGGAILLESPTMTNNGTIAANGGGGGGQSATTEAQPGQLSATPAAGAVVNQTGVSNHAGGGGAGAAGTTGASAGGGVIDLNITGTNGGGAGGAGGGGAGRIRLNNAFGVSPGGTISPATSTGAATVGTCTGS